MGLSLGSVLTVVSQARDADGPPMTIAVCDAAGDLILLHRDDEEPGFSAEFAAGKAYTAARFGNPTSDLEEAWAQRPVFAHSLLTQGKWFVGRGGIPVFGDGSVVGAVGVSGAEATDEEAVAITIAGLLERGL